MVACFDIDAYSEHESSIAHPAPPGCRVYLTKRPGEILSVLWPLAVDPDLYVICCIRDPRDSIVSRHEKRPNAYWCGLRFWKHFAQHHASLARCSQVLFVRYEDFVRDPDATQCRIATFLPFLARRHCFSEFHQIANPSKGSLRALRGIRQIDTTAIGRWRDHLPRIKQQVLMHGGIGASLVEHGYEPDTSWERLLDAVEPGNFETAVDEQFKLRYQMQRRVRGMIAAGRAILRQSTGRWLGRAA
jgi:hypothetical protein